MTLTEFMARVAAQNAAEPGSHTLFPGLTDAEWNSWQAENPTIQLPPELLALLRWSNGLGLHQGYYDGEPIYHDGAYRFYPLAELTRADLAMYGVAEDNDPRMPRSRWACCLGPDASVYFGFDIETLHFWRLEPICPEESADLGPRIKALLECVF